MDKTRRAFLGFAARLGALSASTALGFSRAALGQVQNNGARVVIIGGGFAGATCAKYLRRADPSLAVIPFRYHY